MRQASWIALCTIVQRECVRIFRIWPQTLLPPVLTSALYFIVFGYLLGQHIRYVQDVSYIQYLTPGLVMMVVINNAFGNVATSFYSQKFQHSIDELLVAPISNEIIILGYVIGGTLRGLLVGGLVMIAALFFHAVLIQHFFLLILIFLLASVLFSLLGLINAIYANKFDDIAIIPTFLLTPLTYLGGVFYSVLALPVFWYHLSLLNPILYLVEAFRFAMIGVSDIGAQYALLILLFLTVAAFLFARFLLIRGYSLRT